MSVASVAYSHVYGIKSEIRDNILYLDDNTVIYPAGNNIIISNFEQHTQRFVPGSSSSSSTLPISLSPSGPAASHPPHTANVTNPSAPANSEYGGGFSCLTVSPDSNLFAIAERGCAGAGNSASSGGNASLQGLVSRPPTIHVYDVHSFRKRKTLVPASETFLSREFTHMHFSPDSKFLVAQLGPPDHILHYFAWEKGKVISSIPVGGPKPANLKTSADGQQFQQSGPCQQGEKTIRQVTVHPSDGTLVCVSGDNGLFAVYRYADASFGDVEVRGMPAEQDYRTHCWITPDRIAVGTGTGIVYVLEDFATCQIISTTLESVESIIALTSPMGFVVGGKGGPLLIYEWVSAGTMIHHQHPVIAPKRGAPTKSAVMVKDVLANMQKVVEDGYHLTKAVPLPDNELWGIRTMTMSASQLSLLAELENNQILKLSFTPPDECENTLMAAGEASMQSANNTVSAAFRALSQPFHHGAITGLDLCCRKPLVATCSSDKSIRLWNYLSGQVDLVRYFPDEPFSVSLHPSGLYVLAGFSDKLRLMNVLMDDLRLYKEFAVRACREVRFSNGGHLFAAAHGNAIQVFNTWTFDIVAVLKGHNGKVRSLHWTPDDQFLVSAGSDGAVYTWSVLDSKRESEHILKGCGYSSAVCTSNGKKIYAVGSDRMLKQITDSAVTCEIDCGLVLTQIILSHSGRMMFAGTSSGTVRSMKYPLSGDASDYQEHEAHSGAVTRFRVSYDDQFLFSTGEDGCLYQFRVSNRDDRGIKRERGLQFADEILITKSDMEEKAASTLELQRSLEELKLEHEYQIRLRDMSFGERLKDVSEKHAQEIESLKISTSILRGEKDKEEARHDDEADDQRAMHANELHDLETKFSTELMAEFDKFAKLQVEATAMQNEWDAQIAQFDIQTREDLAACSSTYESRLSKKVAEITKLQEELGTLQREHAETSKHLEEEGDAESESLIQKYERKLRSEREEGARLKGENGIMRKKFLTLSKDIEDHRQEIARLREEEKRLRTIVANLEKDAAVLKKEMGERDENIQEGERRMYDLKKKNQELEKFKFVLDFRIKELKEQVEPREQDISRMRDGIEEINVQLGRLASHKQKIEESIQTLLAELSQLRHEYTTEQKRARDVSHRIRSFRSELMEAVQYIQDPDKLRKSISHISTKYGKPAKGPHTAPLDPAVEHELTTHNADLWSHVKHLRAQVVAANEAYHKDHGKAIHENKALLEEINVLRRAAIADQSDRPARAPDASSSGPRRRYRTRPGLRLPPVAPNADGNGWPAMIVQNAVSKTASNKY
ncbi:hypothetical protein SeMB42_g05538 [Synchytrium endobioticum]|uniref:EML-like second beta-propeller domain-containing protein n=1 Tax=Synchytrium endobioticum TaxID=286115 RepID=A0A507D8S8_9FUNG|nr:hypothetical protein SeMB42_g05538 [Synchytrium endobioticum]TPX47757.1 hypothetical protein SeLEV6574_g02458 [Synchytrium endobioticum]